MAVLRLILDVAGVQGNARKAKAAIADVKGEASRTERSLGAASKRIAAFGAALGAAAVAFGTKSVSAFREYNKALTEVTTLLSGTEAEVDRLDGAAKRLAATYGIDATNQVKAFYQAISAGVGDAAQATEFLNQANKLAIGGVTDITTAVDGLTTVTNAYKESGLSAADASDILFTGVKQGKTTIEELSSTLGNVVPLAASVGVSLEEVVAGVAALTSKGQSTSTAVTGIRQALAALVKPSSEAERLASRLGIQFNTQALEAKGLAGVLDDVAQATGGNTALIAKLFGSVEALNAVLALAGEAGDTFRQNLEGMANASGATDEAFRKVSESLEFRLNTQLQLFKNISLEVGEFLLSGIVPALEIVTRNIDSLAVAFVGFGTIAGVTFAPVIGPIVALGGAILVAANNWDKFRAAGSLALREISALTGITTKDVESLWSKTLSKIGDLWELQKRAVRGYFNFLIGSGIAAARISSTVFNNIPGLLELALKQSFNFIVERVKDAVSLVTAGVNRIIQAINGILEFLGKNPINPIPDLSPFLDRFKLQASDGGRAAGEALAAAMNKAITDLTEDHIGNLVGGILGSIDRLTEIRDISSARENAIRNAALNPVGASTTAGTTPGFLDTSRIDERLHRETKSLLGEGNDSSDETAGNTGRMVDLFGKFPDQIDRSFRAANENLISNLDRFLKEGSTGDRQAPFEDATITGGVSGPATPFEQILFDRAQRINQLFLDAGRYAPVATGVSTLGRFQHGGFGTVPGSGGIDSQLVVARATPGEPYAFGDFALNGTRRGGEPPNGPTVINNTINLNVPRQSETPVLPNRQTLRRDLEFGASRLAG